jgi:hypothetical protein
MNVKDVLQAFIDCNSSMYDGLCNPDMECSCERKDLFPCGGTTDVCLLGHKIPGCTAECGCGCSFHVQPGRNPKTHQKLPVLGKIVSLEGQVKFESKRLVLFDDKMPDEWRGKLVTVNVSLAEGEDNDLF